MKIIYNNNGAEPYNFRKLGATVTEENGVTTVELNQAAYDRFAEETRNTAHTHSLWKANHAFTRG